MFQLIVKGSINFLNFVTGDVKAEVMSMALRKSRMEIFTAKINFTSYKNC